MKSYDYKTRKGIKRISWNNFHDMSKMLAKKVSKDDIDVIIGIARAGLYPAVLIAELLRKEIYPVRITRRENDQVKYDTPVWITEIPDQVKNKNVLIIDDIADTGETLALAAKCANEKSAKSVKTATLIIHSWADPRPDYYAVKTDKLVIFEWDKQILINGRWKLHPEIAEAIKMQKKQSRRI